MQNYAREEIFESIAGDEFQAVSPGVDAKSHESISDPGCSGDNSL